MLLDALDEVLAFGLMRPQPEGLQEAGQQWTVFDLTAACAAGGAADRAVVAAAAAPEGAPVSAGVRPRLAPACRLLSSLRAAGAGASPPYEPLKAQFSTNLKIMLGLAQVLALLKDD